MAGDKATVRRAQLSQNRGIGARFRPLSCRPLYSIAYVIAKRAHPDLNQGPADLQSAALTTELCTLLAETSDAFAFLGMHLAAWRQCD